MPQSMIAILAMMLFSLFAVQQQEQLHRNQSIMIQQAVSAMVNGAAVERLEEIGSKGFDQATEDNEVLLSSAQLSSLDNEFGPTGDHTADDDLDDFHMAVDTLSRAVGESELTFRLYSEVRYASENNPERDASAGQRTKYKIVKVTAESLDIEGVSVVTLSRTFACGSACTW